jgi:hypothetical protein
MAPKQNDDDYKVLPSNRSAKLEMTFLKVTGLIF